MNINVLIFVIISFALSLLLVPLIIKFCKFYSIYDTVNARKIHSGNISRLGGIAIVVAFLASTILCFYVDKTLSFRNSLPLLVSGSLIFIVGILDDIFELNAIVKLLAQIVVSSIVVFGGFRFTQIFGFILHDIIGIILTFFWILGIINAYNLIDGMDGLCASLSILSLGTLGIMMFHSCFEGTAICFMLLASILGFLVFNWPQPNAKIFMGDAGSQFLGFMIATIPLYSSNLNFEYNKFLAMLVIVSFPMLDTIAAIWRRIRDHRPIMSPDRLHLHHKLLNLGFSKRHALIAIIVIQSLICIVVFFCSIIGNKAGLAFLVVAYFFMIAFFCVIHYTNRAVMIKIRTENENRNNEVTPEL